MKKLTVDDAKVLLEAIPSDRQDAIEAAHKELSRCKPDQMLVRKTKHRNQLRANYTIIEGDERVTLSCSVSGVVVCPIQVRTCLNTNGATILR